MSTDGTKCKHCGSLATYRKGSTKRWTIYKCGDCERLTKTKRDDIKARLETLAKDLAKDLND